MMRTHRRLRDQPRPADAGDPRSSCSPRARSAYISIPKEANPDVTIPIIYVQLSAARHLAGGRRAAAGAADGDGAEVDRQRQGDARGRLRGRRLRAARVRGRLRFRRGARRTCAPRSTTPSATCRPTPTSRACIEVNLSLFPVVIVTLSGDLSERALGDDRAPGAGRHRAGAGRARRPTLQGTRDEVVEIIAEPMLLKSYGVVARPVRVRRGAGQQPGRRRRARRPAGPLRGQGAGADRNAGGRAQHSGRRVERRGGHARRRRQHPPDLQGRDVDHPRQRPPGRRHRGVEARRRQPHRDGRRASRRRSRRCRSRGRRRVQVQLPAGPVEVHHRHADRPAEQRHHRGHAGRRSSSSSSSAGAPRSSSASPSRSRSWSASSASAWPG